MCDMTSLEMDTLSRNKIVSEIDKNFFVEAGAGSGKTTMLVNRMVAMVESGIPIEKICAITFTKAAANEFYERFQKLLIERSNPVYGFEDKGLPGQLKAPTDATRKLCEKALQNIDLCFMGTIDSFCSMILSEHPSEAGIPSDSRNITNEEAATIYKQQFVKICAGDHGEDLKKQADAFKEFYYNAQEVFVSGVSVFMKNRNVHFNYKKLTSVDIDTEFADKRSALIKALEYLEKNKGLLSETNDGARNAKEKVGDTLKTLKSIWSSNIGNVIYALKKISSLRVLQKGMDEHGLLFADFFDEDASGRDKSHLINIGGSGGLLEQLKEQRYYISVSFMEKCVPVLEKELREKGCLTFFDYLYYLRNMLKKDAEGEGKLIRYIYDRHSYFLIDEFQDTNPMQAEIFFYLSSENPVPAWYECAPRPGSLFIVGDPKQSIYHFRGADVSSFLKIKKLFEERGGELLMLSRNFRSTDALCGFFNRVFKNMLPHETAYQSKFEEIPLPGRGQDEFQGVFKYSAYTGKLIAEHPKETDPLQIKKIIKTLVDNDAYLICGKKGEEPRHIRYSDIMVITYGKKKLAPIMQVLGETGIPTKVEGSVPFGQNAALIEIYKIYSAVADPNDCISLYGALTGGIIGLDIEDIQLYRKENGVISLHFDLESIDFKEEAACKVAAEIEKLKKLRNASYKLSPAALFAKIMDDSRVYLTSELKDPEVVYYTLELLREAEKSGAVVSHMDGVAYIEQLLGGNSDKERCLSLSDSIDAVHMANLHKVKGLEAPIVILAATQEFQSSCDLRIVHKDDGSEGYLFSLSKPDDNGVSNGYYFETSEYAKEKNEESAAGEAEHIRLIYVAATRARNALIVCDSIKAQGRGQSHRSKWEELLAEASDFNFSEEADDDGKEAGAERTALAIDLYDEAEKTCVLNDRSREKASYSVGVPSHIKLASKLSEEQEVNVITVPDDMIDTAEEGTPEKDDKENGAKDKIKYHLLPALVGTMTHRLMEMLVSSKNMINDKEAIREVINEYITPATEKYEKQLRTMLENVSQTIRAGGYPQINGAPQDILGTLLAVDEVYCEVPFSYKENTEEGQTVWNGIMDVVYASGGKWHIVDYKTNADGSDLDNNYKDQLEAYIKAFKATTGQDADAKTYHINV